MNILGIQCFVVTAEEMNFTRAAEKLNMSQQALSGHIKRLEDEYSVLLFQRKPFLRLTKEGEEFLFFSRRILQEERRMRSRLSDISENNRATLRVGVSRIRAKAFFPIIWKLYHKYHRNISVDLVNGNTDRMLQFLDTGKMDLLIGVDIEPNPDYTNIKLAEEPLYTCVTKEFLLRYMPDGLEAFLEKSREGLDLYDLPDLPYIMLRPGNRLRTAVDQYLLRRVNPDCVLECDEQEVIYDLALAGDGFGIVSPVVLYIHRDNLPEGLITLPLKGVARTTASLIYRNIYPLPQYALDFIQCTTVAFGGYNRNFQL